MIDSNVHILPGVDDGAMDEEHAIYMLEKAKADGITHWIVTPHFNHKSSKYTYEVLKRKYDEWFHAYGENYASGNLIFGMEVFIDDNFLENLDKISRLPTYENSHYMLVSFDLAWSYDQIKNALQTLIKYGIIPILAHAEIYPDLAENAIKVKLLSEEGVLIQLTASSFMKKNHQKFIRDLFILNAVDLVASNGHDPTIRPPTLSEAYNFVTRYYSKSWANRLFIDTPMKIFYGEQYFRPLNTLKLRKSHRISMGASIIFGLTLVAVGISQMTKQPPMLIGDSEITITEEAIPAGFAIALTYDDIIAKGNERCLEIFDNYESDLSAINELILNAQKEIPDLVSRISKIEVYLSDALVLERQYDAAMLNQLHEIEEELQMNGYTTGSIEGFKSTYEQFKESIKTKYLVMF